MRITRLIIYVPANQDYVAHYRDATEEDMNQATDWFNIFYDPDDVIDVGHGRFLRTDNLDEVWYIYFNEKD